MRIMAIDYGDARTGIAISDLTGTITGQTLTIHEHNVQKTAQQIADLVMKWDVEILVLGYPKNMNATLGARAEKSEAFCAVLAETTGLSPVLWDERRTTVDAHRILSDNNRRGKKRKNTVDAVAASLILESYLNFIKNKKD